MLRLSHPEPYCRRVLKRMQEYLWKYVSLDKFISIIENQGLYFTTIQNLKNNVEPDECCILDYYLKTQIENTNALQKDINFVKKLTPEVERIINKDKNLEIVLLKMKEYYYKFEQSKNDFSNICSDAIKNIFVCSFSKDSTENYALWKIYPTDLNGNQQLNQGLALKFKKEHLLKIIQNPTMVLEDGTSINHYRVHLKEMQYKSREEIIVKAKQLLESESCKDFYELLHSLKLEYYQYEKEERAIMQMFGENKNNCKGGFLKIPLEEIFEAGQMEIHISPYATKSLISYVEFLLNKYNINSDILIRRSDINIVNT